MSNNTFELHENRVEPWKVTILYTGENTMTGGRLLAAKDFIGTERFMLTYGDGVSNIDIPSLIEAHKKSGKYVTLTAVRPSGRFGALDINQEGTVNSFKEKQEGDNSWINGGFFVMEPIVFDYLTNGADTVLERKPLETLASENQLHAYKHSDFWQAMDTLRDKNELAELWQKGTKPWALWGNGF